MMKTTLVSHSPPLIADTENCADSSLGSVRQITHSPRPTTAFPCRNLTRKQVCYIYFWLVIDRRPPSSFCFVLPPRLFSEDHYWPAAAEMGFVSLRKEMCKNKAAAEDIGTKWQQLLITNGLEVKPCACIIEITLVFPPLDATHS